MIRTLKAWLEKPSSSKQVNEGLEDTLKKNMPDNKEVKGKQGNLLIIALSVTLISVLALVSIVQGKVKKKVEVPSNVKAKVEVASEALDPEKMWRNHFEDMLAKSKNSFEEKLKLAEESFALKETELLKNSKEQLSKMQTQLDFARRELEAASVDLKRASSIQEDLNSAPKQNEHIGNISSTTLSQNIEFDQPKLARDYIPETSYVSGYLITGLAVSTALNTPDENAPPVVIRLTSRGNLPKNFTTDISTCRILGSSYGDLSSERAIIRAEKMVCIDPETEMVTTSKIVGTIHGPDGMNGVKGKVVATSNKHIKNAMIGGVISGLANSAKGQEGMTISALGAVGTKKKGFKDMATGGVLTGASTAGEKIADYYLRMAESMSPVLTIPGGVKVDIIFMKGFYVGELSTHKKVKDLRELSKKQGNDRNGEEYDN